MSETTRDALAQMTLAAGRLETLIVRLQQQAVQAQAALQAAREQEETRFRQAMGMQFQDLQQRLEAALRPKVAWSWKIITVLAGFSALLLMGYGLLVKQADARLRTAQARADAMEVKAEILEASRHLEITSCGGHPCIRIDRETATWKSRGREYILVHGRPDMEKRERP